jgi:hypothetical protein
VSLAQLSSAALYLGLGQVRVVGANLGLEAREEPSPSRGRQLPRVVARTRYGRANSTPKYALRCGERHAGSVPVVRLLP